MCGAVGAVRAGGRLVTGETNGDKGCIGRDGTSRTMRHWTVRLVVGEAGTGERWAASNDVSLVETR
jgi:hypothetical protein